MVDVNISGLDVYELRWVSVHVETPLSDPRISDRFISFHDKIQLGTQSMPEAYMQQITNKVKEGYWWEVYGKPIWNQIPKLVDFLKEHPDYNKPSITVRNSVEHFGGLQYSLYDVSNLPD